MCFSPYEREPWFLNPGNFCLWNLESWALESGIHLKESGIPRTIGIQNPSSTDKHWFFTHKNGDFGAVCQIAALFNWLLNYNKGFFSHWNAYICFFFLFHCQTMTEWNVHGLVSNKTVILRRLWQPPTQALLGELVFRLPGFRGGSGI